MDKVFVKKLFQSHQAGPTFPSPEEVSHLFTQLLGILFPDFSTRSFPTVADFESHCNGLQSSLQEMVRLAPGLRSLHEREIAQRFFEALPVIHQKLESDVIAMYEGDPAAKSTGGIPRVITEHAHSKTGIDIHPGARIGEHFCIDHGTGVVVGETTVIGNHVKIYQGVTLGALSVDKSDAIKKRHPTIEDHVIIYAGATILGGESIIGHDSVIGGNVWLTRSVPAFSKIYYQAKMYNGDTDETDLVVFKSDGK